MSVRIHEGAYGTWIEAEDAAGPRAAMRRKGRARFVPHGMELRPGGIETYPLRAIRCGISDSFFAAPGFVLVDGKREHGSIFFEDGVFVFRLWR